MLMAKGLDTGDILEQKETEILPTDTGESLTLRLAEMGGELILSTIDKLAAGSITPVKQNDEESSYAKMLDKALGKLDFKEPAEVLERKIRALTPRPGAYAFFAEKKLILISAEVVSGEGNPGSVIEVTKKNFTVACGKDALRVKKLQS